MVEKKQKKMTEEEQKVMAEEEQNEERKRDSLTLPNRNYKCEKCVKPEYKSFTAIENLLSHHRDKHVTLVHPCHVRFLERELYKLM